MNVLDRPSKSSPDTALWSRSIFTTPSFSQSDSNDLGMPAISVSCPLDPPFSILYDYSRKDIDQVVHTFPSSPLYNQLSPTSSASSGLDSPKYSSSRNSLEIFIATRSRVVRLFNLPRLFELYLSALFYPQNIERSRERPLPISLWTLREESERCNKPESIWAVFKSHEEAVAALSLSGSTMSVTTALESDLEPFYKLRRFVLTPLIPSSQPPITTGLNPQLRPSISHPDLQITRMSLDRSPRIEDYSLSSNPPNPKSSFRLGDWICSSPNCAAHNFGRNLNCIGCGCPRSGDTGAGTSTRTSQQSHPTTRNASSPRFASFSSPNSNSLPTPPATQPAPPQQLIYSSYHHHHQQQQQQQPSQPPVHHQQQHRPVTFNHSPSPVSPARPAHPLLTPSGRAFAIGGRVQNISSDPLSPCIMFWPDNEPLPEQGQIRPGGLVGIPQPPILNTGNKGPIAHQPGDWVCQKCNYLNWRRRKVCQTCLPYAEGNGDSVSIAVQAERIALLTSVLARTQGQTQGQSTQGSLSAHRSHSMTPPEQRRSFIDVPSPQVQNHQPLATHAPVHRSHSHLELGARYYNHDASPIYQTSGNRQRQPSPLYSTGPDLRSLPVHAPAPLLPSFLQDIVQSPALSPTSTSSADLSFEESEDIHTNKISFPRTHSADGSSTDSPPIGNIWRLDGEESKSLSAFALPNREDLIGTGRKNSKEGLRLQPIST